MTIPSSVPTVAEFADDAARCFAFLASDYGFVQTIADFMALAPGHIGEPQPVHTANAKLHEGIVLVRFQSAKVIVEICDDPRLETTCQLSLADSPTKRIDLFHVRQYCGETGPLYKWGKVTTHDVLVALSAALARHGGPWLRGEVSAWQDILDWCARGMPARA